MKKLLVPFICMLLAVCNNIWAQPQDGAKFKFIEETHDFGVVPRGPVAMYRFQFKNVGNQPLFVYDVTPSCGCTNVDWIKSPVLPGQDGFIQLGLKTEEQHGVFKKEVYIRTNAYIPNGEKRYTLYIKGNAVDDTAKVKKDKK